MLIKHPYNEIFHSPKNKYTDEEQYPREAIQGEMKGKFQNSMYNNPIFYLSIFINFRTACRIFVRKQNVFLDSYFPLIMPSKIRILEFMRTLKQCPTCSIKILQQKRK